MSATHEELFARLDELGIDTTTVEHLPVFTVEEAKAQRGELTGAHIKNLFLRNKKRTMWLVILLEDRQLDLKSLGKRIGAGHVSFARPERLREFLGVEPGAVTPFAVINDPEGHVSVVIDAAALGRDPIQAHPLRNDMTTAIAAADLLSFMRACGHDPAIVDFDQEK